MKKLFLSLAVVASVALVSCGGNKAEKEAEETAPEATEVEAAGAAQEVEAEGVVMKDTVIDGQTVQVPVATVTEVVTEGEAAAATPQEN